MPRQLHLIVSPPDEFAQAMIHALREQPGAEVEVVDWTNEKPDYAAAVAKIFAADSIVTW